MFLSKLLPFSRYKISGHSMEPIYNEGQVILVFNWAYLFVKPKINDIVVFRWEGKHLVKRLKEVNGSKFKVVGDNEDDSLDSRQFGFIEASQVIGKVI